MGQSGQIQIRSFQNYHCKRDKADKFSALQFNFANVEVMSHSDVIHLQNQTQIFRIFFGRGRRFISPHDMRIYLGGQSLCVQQ